MDIAAIPGWSLHSKKQSNPLHKDPDSTNHKVPDPGGFGFMYKTALNFLLFSRFRADGDHRGRGPNSSHLCSSPGGNEICEALEGSQTDSGLVKIHTCDGLEHSLPHRRLLTYKTDLLTIPSTLSNSAQICRRFIRILRKKILPGSVAFLKFFCFLSWLLFLKVIFKYHFYNVVLIQFSPA